MKSINTKTNPNRNSQTDYLKVLNPTEPKFWFSSVLPIRSQIQSHPIRFVVIMYIKHIDLGFLVFTVSFSDFIDPVLCVSLFITRF